MIIRPILAAVTALAVFAMATPTPVFAAASQTKIKAALKKLKKLPTRATPAAKVNKAVKKVTKLNPKQAAKYYRIGLTKLALAGAKQAATKLASDVNKIVKSAGLSSSEANKISKQVINDEVKFNPAPAPTPYVASVRLVLAGAAA